MRAVLPSRFLVALLSGCLVSAAQLAAEPQSATILHRGFDSFSKGTLGDAGANMYVFTSLDGGEWPSLSEVELQLK